VISKTHSGGDMDCYITRIFHYVVRIHGPNGEYPREIFGTVEKIDGTEQHGFKGLDELRKIIFAPRESKPPTA
jgi:hypothetical protein